MAGVLSYEFSQPIDARTERRAAEAEAAGLEPPLGSTESELGVVAGHTVQRMEFGR